MSCRLTNGVRQTWDDLLFWWWSLSERHQGQDIQTQHSGHNIRRWRKSQERGASQIEVKFVTTLLHGFVNIRMALSTFVRLCNHKIFFLKIKIKMNEWHADCKAWGRCQDDVERRLAESSKDGSPTKFSFSELRPQFSGPCPLKASPTDPHQRPPRPLLHKPKFHHFHNQQNRIVFKRRSWIWIVSFNCISVQSSDS